MKNFAYTVDNSMLATGNQRFLNYIIDTVIYYLLLFILGVIAGVLSLIGYDGMLLWLEEMHAAIEFVLNIGIMLLYFLFMESLTQRTLGKYITGTKVVLHDGTKPVAGIIAVRTLCRLIPFEQFSFLGSAPRGWHDSISKTYVIDIKKYNAEVYRRTALDEIGQDPQY